MNLGEPRAIKCEQPWVIRQGYVSLCESSLAREVALIAMILLIG